MGNIMSNPTAPYARPNIVPDWQLNARGCPQHEDQGSPIRHRGQTLRLAQESMVANGWCSHQVKHLSNRYDIKTFSYLATLEPSPYRRVSHDRCANQDKCVAYNTAQNSTYRTRHATSGCTCRMVSMPYEELSRIIRDNKMPLVSIEQEKGTRTRLRLRVHTRSQTSEYIAISHVWADGLGNPGKNALPMCQLRQLNHWLRTLRRLYKNSKEPYLFWMDTLCIPIRRDDLALKLSQIDKMASIYRGALTSLVLDAELMSIPLDFDYATRKLYPEARARIACSAWMSRSWTLQEGFLTPSIAVKSLDDIIFLGRVSARYSKYVERPTNKEMAWYNMRRERVLFRRATPSIESELDSSDDYIGLADISTSTSDAECECVDIALRRAFLSTFFRPYNKFIQMWNVLCSRSTTQHQDVPLIVTNVMGFENRELFKYQESYEMWKAIILSLQSPPMSIFFNTGLRYKPNGNHRNRWVPLEISGDPLLLTKAVFSVSPKHLTYDLDVLEDGEIGRWGTVYAIGSAIETNSIFSVKCASDRTTYIVDPCISGTDKLNRSKFSRTYIVIGDGLMPNHELKTCGACFYGNKPQYGSAEVIYNCPLRIQKVINERHQGISMPETSHSVLIVEDLDKLMIRYDPLPGFKPLRQRRLKFRRAAIVPYFIGIFAFFAILAGLSVGVFKARHVRLETFSEARTIYFASLTPIGILLAILVLLLCEYVIRPYFSRRAAWNYTRSFEVIAADRQARGEV
ncbi:hypothetical protein F5Y16DRAFT_381046 [Xylariaceae sp. FL0255]|nr:hypothetical protein F5Y16DRAFT_381046 [Xylariaceae sp. FL0255]